MRKLFCIGFVIFFLLGFVAAAEVEFQEKGSGNMFSLVQANGMIVVPSGVKSLKAGSEIVGWFL